MPVPSMGHQILPVLLGRPLSLHGTSQESTEMSSNTACSGKKVLREGSQKLGAPMSRPKTAGDNKGLAREFRAQGSRFSRCAGGTVDCAGTKLGPPPVGTEPNHKTRGV